MDSISLDNVDDNVAHDGDAYFKSERIKDQNHRGISCTCTCRVFLRGCRYKLIFPCLKAGMTSFQIRLLGKEKLSVFCRTHEQIKVVKEQ